MNKVSWNIGRQRLLKLAKHLRNNKLSVKQFAFNVFRQEVNNPKAFVEIGEADNESLPKNFCGTAGCAIGECPAIFSRYWEFRNQDKEFPRPVLKKGGSGYTAFQFAEIFFGLETYDHATALFSPNEQDSSSNGIDEPKLKLLNDTATPKQVAANILSYVNWYDTKLKVEKLWKESSKRTLTV